MNEMIRGSSTVEHQLCKLGVAGSAPAPGTIFLSGHQPVYLPGIILFNKIAMSDAFMFVGHCQHVAKSWHTRNYIRQGNDKIMLTVPVEKSFGQSIDKIRIINGNWRDKHIRSIEQSYRKRPFFDAYFPGLYQLISHRHWESLGEMNMAIIVTMMEWLHIETQVLESWQYDVQGHKTDMLVSMCQCSGYENYLSSPGEAVYVEKDKFSAAGIGHSYQQFTHPIYDQGHKNFIPNLSAIDLLFNCGAESAKIIRSCHVG